MARTHDEARAWYDTVLAVYRQKTGRDLAITDREGVSLFLSLDFERGFARGDLERQIDGILGGPPATPPTPPPTPVAPLPMAVGRVGFDGASYTDQRGRRLFCTLHAGDLPMRFVMGRRGEDPAGEADTHQAFADARTLGLPCIRGWSSINWEREHPFWVPGGAGGVPFPVKLDPVRDWQHLAEFTRIAHEGYGLVLHLALGDVDQVPAGKLAEYWRLMAELLRLAPERIAWCEGLNEAEGTGQPDPRIVERWLDPCRAVASETQQLYALSAGAGGASEELANLRAWTPQWMRTYYVHGYQDGGSSGWGNELRHAYTRSIAEGYPVRRNGYDGEPRGMNWGPHQLVSGSGSWHESRPWRLALYLCQMAMCRQWPTLMCSHGVRLPLGARFTECPGIDLGPRLLAELPPDIMAFDTLVHGGQTHQGTRVFEAPAGYRVDQAIDSGTGRAVAVAYPDGVAGGSVSVRADRPWQGRIHHSRGWTDAAWSPGQRHDLDLTDGALLVGQMG